MPRVAQRSGKGDAVTAERAAKRKSHGKCPICGRPRVAEWRPFCSKRCADLDLARWLGEGYAIPGEPADTLPLGAAEDADDRSS